MPKSHPETTSRTVLQDIVAHKRDELALRMQQVPLEALQAQCTPCQSRFTHALQGPGVRLIAEIKPRSPSQGLLASSLDLPSLTRLFNKYACAISVLTDEKYFGGSLVALAEVCRSATVPVLCKEFVLHPYQVFEARQCGAQAVLLIVKILDDEALALLQDTSRKLGMTALIEVQTEHEVKRALSIAPDVLLINNRNLETFAVDMGTCARLASQIPPGLPFISASGVDTRADLDAIMPHTNKFLIGSALMRSSEHNSQQPQQESLAAVESKLKELCVTC
jgi:indole-3-glycerol phosphate synthase